MTLLNTVLTGNKNKINLVMVVPKLPPGQGGMERQAYLQARVLAEKTNLTVCSISSDPNLFDDLSLRFIRLRPYTGFLSREINSFRLLVAVIFNGCFFRNKIFYCHQINLLTSLILMICFFLKKQIFVKVANSGKKFDLKVMLDRYRFLKPLTKLFEYSGVHYLCLNPQNKKDFEVMGINNAKIYDFRNGINLPPKIETQVKSNIIQYVGRLEPIKEIEYIFKLIEHLPDNDTRIIGDGTKFDNLAATAKHYKRVKLLGELPSERVQWSDVEWAILPSKSEGMSNMLLEALVHGRGIICRPIPANKFISDISDKIVWIEGQPEDVATEVLKKSGIEANINDAIYNYSIETVTDDFLRIVLKEGHTN